MKRKEEESPGNLGGKKIKTGCGLLVLFFVAIVLWAFIEPHVLTVTRITIKERDIPEVLNGFRIAHLSDIHHGPHVSLRFVRRMVEKTNQLQPDLVLITGDYISRGDEEFVAPCMEVLKDLKSRYGVFSVLGNQDHWTDVELVRKHLKLSGIENLENKSKWIYARGTRFKVGGVGDLKEATQDLEPTLTDITKDDFVILLSHNPDYVWQVPEDRIDLMLCGHTHGGQITFFGLFAPILHIKSGQKYRSGVVEKGTMRVIISRGLGTISWKIPLPLKLSMFSRGLKTIFWRSSPPIRFFSPPQIILITLEHGEDDCN